MIWKIIPNTFGKYSASHTGEIRNNEKNFILKQSDSHKYKTVRFTVKGKRSNQLVHRLVALCFISNPNKYPEVNHKDGVKSNNHISNLEWCTRKENVKHANDNGLCNYSKKINKEIAEKIRKDLKIFKTNRQVALKYNLSEATISEIKNNKTWIS